MLRIGLGIGILGLAVAWGVAGPVVPQGPIDLNLPGHKIVSRFVKVQGGQRTQVMVSGKNGIVSPLIIYVYDAHGNCVAWDDEVAINKTADEPRVEWFATENAIYSVGVSNAGWLSNKASMLIR